MAIDPIHPAKAALSVRAELKFERPEKLPIVGGIVPERARPLPRWPKPK
jgi:hypothetical protein